MQGLGEQIVHTPSVVCHRRLRPPLLLCRPFLLNLGEIRELVGATTPPALS